MKRYFIFGERVTRKEFLNFLIEMRKDYSWSYLPSCFNLNSYCYYWKNKGRYIHIGTVNIK